MNKEKNARDLSDKTIAGECDCRKYDGPEYDTARRQFLCGAGALVAVAASRGVSAAIEIPGKTDQKKEGGEALNLPPQIGDRLTYFQNSRRGTTLKLDDIPHASKQIVALPFDKAKGYVRDGSTYNQLMVQRFDNFDEMDSATAERALAAGGVIVYSAICTHFGCIVSGWDQSQEKYMCPCHQSLFDPRSSADIVHGPAPRRLPSLPVVIEDGEIVVAGDFDAPVGIGRTVR